MINFTFPHDYLIYHKVEIENFETKEKKKVWKYGGYAAAHKI